MVPQLDRAQDICVSLLSPTRPALVWTSGPFILFFVPTFGPSFELVESGALKPLVDARDFELTTAGVGDIVKASMTHRTKGKLVLTVSKQ